MSSGSGRAKYGRISRVFASGCVGLLLILASASFGRGESTCGSSVTVQPGETLYSIAERCGTNVAALEEANPDIDPHAMAVGLELRISGDPDAPAQPDEPAGAPANHYIVQPGDTPVTIATVLGVTMDALIDTNPGIESNLIAGQSIMLPPGAEVPDGMDDGRREVVGVMTDEGVECQALRGEDGELYTLIGDLGSHRTGEIVQVRGLVPEASHCQQGVTIEVEEIQGVG